MVENILKYLCLCLKTTFFLLLGNFFEKVIIFLLKFVKGEKNEPSTKTA